jgi:hypothetical protein
LGPAGGTVDMSVEAGAVGWGASDGGGGAGAGALGIGGRGLFSCTSGSGVAGLISFFSGGSITDFLDKRPTAKRALLSVSSIGPSDRTGGICA